MSTTIIFALLRRKTTIAALVTLALTALGVTTVDQATIGLIADAVLAIAGAAP
jgi:hypothetical protein